MHSTGFSHTPFLAHGAPDPVRAAEDDIRRYLTRHGVITPPKGEKRRPQTALCLLAIYAAVALVALLGTLLLAKLECDPLFSDRGLKAVCRGRAGAWAKMVGPTAGNPYFSFLSTNLPQ